MSYNSQFANAIKGDNTSLKTIITIGDGLKTSSNSYFSSVAFNLNTDFTSNDPTLVGGSSINVYPFLLSAPQMTSSIDILDHKYTNSNVTLNFSNSKYNNEGFMDVLNAPLTGSLCTIAFMPTNSNDYSSANIVYIGKIIRQKSNKNSIKVVVEDNSLDFLETNLPIEVIPPESSWAEKDHGKRMPMVYGTVDRSPTVVRVGWIGDEELIELGEGAGVAQTILADRKELSSLHFSTINHGIYTLPQSPLYIDLDGNYMNVVQEVVGTSGEGESSTDINNFTISASQNQVAFIDHDTEQYSFDLTGNGQSNIEDIVFNEDTNQEFVKVQIFREMVEDEANLYIKEGGFNVKLNSMDDVTIENFNISNGVNTTSEVLGEDWVDAVTTNDSYIHIVGQVWDGNATAGAQKDRNNMYIRFLVKSSGISSDYPCDTYLIGNVVNNSNAAWGFYMGASGGMSSYPNIDNNHTGVPSFNNYNPDPAEYDDLQQELRSFPFAQWGSLNQYNSFRAGVPSHKDYTEIALVTDYLDVDIKLLNLQVFQEAYVNDLHSKKYFVNVSGRMLGSFDHATPERRKLTSFWSIWASDLYTSDSVVTHPFQVITHLLEEELGYEFGFYYKNNVKYETATAQNFQDINSKIIETSRSPYGFDFRFTNKSLQDTNPNIAPNGIIQFQFTQQEKIKTRTLIEELTKHTNMFCRFDSKNRFSISTIRERYKIPDTETGGIIYGCTDPSADNYSEDANTNDGSCTYDLVTGCMIPGADNYDENALYPCNDCCIIAGNDVVIGCMDDEAVNYNPQANVDDGSCYYFITGTEGCLDENALNFEPWSETNDGTCFYSDNIFFEVKFNMILTLAEPAYTQNSDIELNKYYKPYYHRSNEGIETETTTYNPFSLDENYLEATGSPLFNYHPNTLGNPVQQANTIPRHNLQMQALFQQLIHIHNIMSDEWIGAEPGGNSLNYDNMRLYIPPDEVSSDGVASDNGSPGLDIHVTNLSFCGYYSTLPNQYQIDNSTGGNIGNDPWINWAWGNFGAVYYVQGWLTPQDYFENQAGSNDEGEEGQHSFYWDYIDSMSITYAWSYLQQELTEEGIDQTGRNNEIFFNKIKGQFEAYNEHWVNFGGSNYQNVEVFDPDLYFNRRWYNEDPDGHYVDNAAPGFWSGYGSYGADSVGYTRQAKLYRVRQHRPFQLYNGNTLYEPAYYSSIYDPLLDLSYMWENAGYTEPAELGVRFQFFAVNCDGIATLMETPEEFNDNYGSNNNSSFNVFHTENYQTSTSPEAWKGFKYWDHSSLTMGDVPTFIWEDQTNASSLDFDQWLIFNTGNFSRYPKARWAEASYEMYTDYWGDFDANRGGTISHLMSAFSDNAQSSLKSGSLLSGNMQVRSTETRNGNGDYDFLISSDKVIDANFTSTRIEDVVSRVKVQYNYDYTLGNFSSETDWEYWYELPAIQKNFNAFKLMINQARSAYDTSNVVSDTEDNWFLNVVMSDPAHPLYDVAQWYFPNYEEIANVYNEDDVLHYMTSEDMMLVLPNAQFDYYGIYGDYTYDDDGTKNPYKNSELIIEAKYIRDRQSAELLRRYVVGWGMNQHLIINVKLPLQYIEAEVGDTVAFDKKIKNMDNIFNPYKYEYFEYPIYAKEMYVDDFLEGNNITRAVRFGKNYWLGQEGDQFSLETRCFQTLYPYFLVSKVKKTTRHVELECIQIHDWSGTKQQAPGEMEGYGELWIPEQSDPDDEFNFPEQGYYTGVIYGDDSTSNYTSYHSIPQIYGFTDTMSIQNQFPLPQSIMVQEGNWGHFYVQPYHQANQSYFGQFEGQAISETSLGDMRLVVETIDGTIIAEATWELFGFNGQINDDALNISGTDFGVDGGTTCEIQFHSSWEFSVRINNNTLDAESYIIRYTFPTFSVGYAGDGTFNADDVTWEEVTYGILNTPQGDVNSDGFIDILDVVSIITELVTGAEFYDPRADINQDGLVNVLDLVQIVNHIIEN